MTFIKIMQCILKRSFKGFTFTDEYSNNLKYYNVDNLGLYIHIPFCRSICSFCPYCKEVYNKERCNLYIKYLLKEIDLVSHNNPKKEITSLYFGGGSPALAIDYLPTIINKLKEHFILNESIGIELHPFDVTRENLKKLKKYGITKLSIGIQSFQDKFLDILSRDKFDYSHMFEVLSEFSFETVAFDFIFALEGQTFNDLKTDIDTAFSNGANYAAIYPFIDFKNLDKNTDMKYSNKKKQMLYKLIDYCKSKGYKQDSIWTFSKDGNSKYSSMTRDNFLGFGVSATSVLKDIFKINTFDIDSYIKRIDDNNLPTSLTLTFTLRERMLYYLFWTMYTTKVDSKDFYSFFKRDIKKEFGLEILIAKILGYIYEENNIYYLTKKGIFFYHYYECHYTYRYIDSMWNKLRKKAFLQKLTL